MLNLAKPQTLKSVQTLCVSLLLIASPSALAVEGHIVKQSIVTKLGSEAYVEDHLWQIDDQRFRLDSNSQTRQMSYIFNGRNMYACLKVVDEKFFAGGSANALPTSVQTKLKSGVCLAVPINIATSFLISPHNSVSALDVTESLQLTLKLDKYSTKELGSGEGISKTPCQQQRREYQYTYFAYTANQELINSASEVACHSPTINWRKPLWRQLSRTYLQQKQGRNLKKEFENQKIDALGLDLNKEASYKVADSKKALRTLQVEIKTNSIETIELDTRIFNLPAGFEVIASTKERVAVVENKATREAPAAPKAKSTEKEEGGLIETIPAILRSFLLIPI